MTDRDERMLDWLHVVRLADLDGVRHALTAFGKGGETIILRRAQKWVRRMVELGLVGRAPATIKDGSVIWATRRWAGWREPNPFSQTARHEIAVASVSGRYLERGYEWRRDDESGRSLAHQADGVATRGGEQVVVEVELTQKQRLRYQAIFIEHAHRLEREGVTEIVYLGTANVMRAVARAADRCLLAGLRTQVTTRAAFDLRGRWVEPAVGRTMGNHLATGRRSIVLRGRVVEPEIARGQH